MTTLSSKLEQMLTWFRENRFDFCSYFQTGLADDQIQEILNELPCEMPLEIYELYRWHNGLSDCEEYYSNFLPEYTFNSLEESLNKYTDLVRYAKEFAEDNWIDPSEIWDEKWFPIFLSPSIHLFVMGEDKVKSSSPIFRIFTDNGESHFRYTNITSMITTILECYETGIYYFDEYGILKSDELKEEVIRHKYNQLYLNED
jgi:hypothetical protein